MVKWLQQVKHRGIQFSSNGCSVPVAMSDASNASDPLNSCKQYGYAIMFMGGPVAFISKRLHHAAHNAFHSEYMAMSECSKCIVWLRHLLNEVGEAAAVELPTLLYGDNRAANKLSMENFVSTGNMYIYLSYHFIKEVVANGHIAVKWKRSGFNLSDLMTKGVGSKEIKALLGCLCGYEQRDFAAAIESAEKPTTKEPNPMTYISSDTQYDLLY